MHGFGGNVTDRNENSAFVPSGWDRFSRDGPGRDVAAFGPGHTHDEDRPMPKMIHSMIRVRDEARALDFYRLFGLEIAERLDFESFSLIYLSNDESGFELELTVNKGDTTYDLGNGYGHLAFLEDDLETLHTRLAEAGHAPRDIKDFAPDGETVARFFFVADPDGYEIEVLARKGRFARQ